MSSTRTVMAAFTDFKVAMILSNYRYINIFADRLLAMPDLDDNTKKEHFNSFCRQRLVIHLPDNISAQEQIRASISLLERQYTGFDGTFPPRTPEANGAYFAQLEVALNTYIDRDIWPHDVSVPNDYKELLGLTDGICDPDFRRTSPAPIEVPMEPIHTEDIEETILAPDDGHESIYPVWHQWHGLAVAVGWEAGRGELGDSSCQFLFCRPVDGSEQCGRNGWGWRIRYRPGRFSRKGEAAERDFTVDGVVEFLDLWAKWYERTNIEARIETALNFAYDSE